MNFEQQYQQIIHDALTQGVYEKTRTNVATYGTWGRQIHHDLTTGFPIITTRKVSFRIAFEETMFFLRGDTNTKKLEEKNINIWKSNTSRKFLDSRGLYHLPVGDMGLSYGKQWRSFTGFSSCSSSPRHTTLDQIETVRWQLNNEPESRRIIISAWNPVEISEMALPPCHILQHYRVRQGRFLDLLMYQRSADLFHGVPYNMMGYALLVHLFARDANLVPGKIVYTFGDAHVYESHEQYAKELTYRTPVRPPELLFEESAQDVATDDLQFEHVSLVGYNPYPPMERVEMVV